MLANKTSTRTDVSGQGVDLGSGSGKKKKKRKKEEKAEMSDSARDGAVTTPTMMQMDARMPPKTPMTITMASATTPTTVRLAQ